LWVVVALVSLAALIILFLCIPLDLVFHANVDEKPKFRLNLIWFFGLFTAQLTPLGKKKPKEKRLILSEGKPGDWLHRLRMTYEILQTKGLFKRLISFLRKTFKQIKVRELAGNLKIGLDNPADTGLLFAFMAPLNLAINYFLPNSIKIEPLFSGESFIKGYLYGAIRLWPIQLAASLIGLAVSLPVLRASKKMVLHKWKRTE
jgi:hypothetical protein